MNLQVQRKIESVTNQAVVAVQALAGGMISEVVKLEIASGDSLVAKVGNGTHDLAIEAFMLRYLRDNSELPVPTVIYADSDLLLMEFVAGVTEWDSDSLADLGSLLASSHQVQAESYGLERDTLIGPLCQPNRQSDSWIEFFRLQRLQYMIRVARASGHLPADLDARLRAFAETIHHHLIEPECPVLIHGDMWRTNVIVRGGRVAGIIDPAIYYAHNEMELAYMTLFDGVGPEFFESYQQIVPIERDFYSVRRHIYNLYPLLVHLSIFGAKYLQPLDATLKRFGN